MAEQTALILAEEINPGELFTSEKHVTDLLSMIHDKANEVVADASTAEGRALIKSTAYKIARTKTIILDAGKDHIADLKAKVAQFNEMSRMIRNDLDEFKEEYRRPLTEWEEEKQREKAAKQAELERKAREQQELIKTLGATRNKILRQFDVTMDVEYLGSLTENEFDTKLIEAEQSHSLRQTQEQQAAKEAAKVELGRKRFKILSGYGVTDWYAEDLAEMPEEQWAQVEDDSRIDFEDAKLERQMLAQKAKEAAEAAKRKQDTEHHDAIVAAAAAGLTAVLDVETARKVVELIEQGSVPHVRIEF